MGASARARCRFRLQYNAEKKTSVVRGSIMRSIAVLLASALAATNFTGNPSLTLRTGFARDGTPRGINLWGRLFGEAELLTIGNALERRLDVWHVRPAL